MPSRQDSIGPGRGPGRRIADLERDRLRSMMAEGYRVTRQEDKELTREFEAADLGGWDDY